MFLLKWKNVHQMSGFVVKRMPGLSLEHFDSFSCALQEKQLACERLAEANVELSAVKVRTEREIQNLKEHLRLAMLALQEGQKLGNSLDHWEAPAGTEARTGKVTDVDWCRSDIGRASNVRQNLTPSPLKDLDVFFFSLFNVFFLICHQVTCIKKGCRKKGDGCLQLCQEFNFQLFCQGGAITGRWFHYTGPHSINQYMEKCTFHFLFLLLKVQACKRVHSVYYLSRAIFCRWSLYDINLCSWYTFYATVCSLRQQGSDAVIMFTLKTAHICHKKGLFTVIPLDFCLWTQDPGIIMIKMWQNRRIL